MSVYVNAKIPKGAIKKSPKQLTQIYPIMFTFKL